MTKVLRHAIWCRAEIIANKKGITEVMPGMKALARSLFLRLVRTSNRSGVKNNTLSKGKSDNKYIITNFFVMKKEDSCSFRTSTLSPWGERRVGGRQ